MDAAFDINAVTRQEARAIFDNATKDLTGSDLLRASVYYDNAELLDQINRGSQAEAPLTTSAFSARMKRARATYVRKNELDANQFKEQFNRLRPIRRLARFSNASTAGVTSAPPPVSSAPVAPVAVMVSPPRPAVANPTPPLPPPIVPTPLPVPPIAPETRPRPSRALYGGVVSFIGIYTSAPGAFNFASLMGLLARERVGPEEREMIERLRGLGGEIARGRYGCLDGEWARGLLEDWLDYGGGESFVEYVFEGVEASLGGEWGVEVDVKPQRGDDGGFVWI